MSKGFLGGLLKGRSKKLGLALGGGGAKGSVHIGALRAFAEEGITFDVVAGTSIGSIVGCLYACGYSWREIEGVISSSALTDVKEMLASRMMGKGLDVLVEGMMGKKEFEDLKLPFAAVAVDLDSGEEMVFTKGNLVKSVAASCAIQPYFTAVEVEGRKCVDGAYRNITPCDVAKGLGADFVIGIDLSNHRSSTVRGKKFLDEMYPDNGVPVCDPTAAGYEACDFMLTPDLTPYSSTSFAKMGEMFDLGYFSAKEAMAEIKLRLTAERIRKFN